MPITHVKFNQRDNTLQGWKTRSAPVSDNYAVEPMYVLHFCHRATGFRCPLFQTAAAGTNSGSPLWHHF